MARSARRVPGANPEFIEVDDASTLTAVAVNSIWIENTAGSLNLRDVLSKTGDVFLKAQLSILDAADVLDPAAPNFYNPLETSTDVTSGPRGKANVLGNNITLIATLGAIGELGNDLEIDTDYSNPAVAGTLTSTSSDNTFITESDGRFAAQDGHGRGRGDGVRHQPGRQHLQRESRRGQRRVRKAVAVRQ